MTLVHRVIRAFLRILVDYCNSTSLAGIAYIPNRRYHWTERLFWILCTLIAWVYAVQIIRGYMDLFRDNTVSIAVENVDTRDEPIAFPSIGVCELGYVKEEYARLQAFIESMRKDEDEEYNYDVEDFLSRVVFHNLYNEGSMTTYCAMYEDCDDCVKCPKDGYHHIAALVRANCTGLFSECLWNGKPFDCCRYFRPLETTVGMCYLLNSVQTIEKYGKHWLRLEMDTGSPTGNLTLSFNFAVSTNIMNEDDIPHILLKRLQFQQIFPGYGENLFMTQQYIVNDPLVRSVDTDVRRCNFPDELFNDLSKTNYRRYSYSVCITECLKKMQMKMCNCFHHNMLFGEYENSSKACDLQGMQCLDENGLIAPPTKILQPWRTAGFVCHCYPSCTENEIRVIGRHSFLHDRSQRQVSIKLMILPSQRYRRQIVREGIDVVVSIGGILGLFTGASILSIAEFFYFFTARFALYMADDVRSTVGVIVAETSEDESFADGHEERNTYNEMTATN